MPSAPHPPDAAHPPPTAALLLHHEASGGWHFDWLVEAQPAAGPDDRVASGWRVRVRPDQMQPGDWLDAEPLPPHRALYLRLRLPTELSGGRGTVAPLAHGWLAAPAAPAAPAPICIRWHHGSTMTYRVLTAAAFGAAGVALPSAPATARIQCLSRTP